MNRSDILYYPTVDSTNKALREYVKNAPEGLTVVAGEQTAGKGRMGRSFISKSGGLYMSLLLKPEKDSFSLITSAAAVAVTQVIEEKFGMPCGIKWVNDIIKDGKKVCGILAESVFDGGDKPAAVILGIGINLTVPEGGFPDEIKDIATHLGVCLTADEKIDLAVEIANRILSLYPRPESFVNEYREKSVVIGKEIYIIRGSEKVSGFAKDIDGECGLIVDFGTKTEVLRTGEISVRLKETRDSGMELVLCLDNNKGMLFNNRRQSRDSKVLEDIKNNLKGNLTIFPFSEKLISGAEIPYEIMSDTVSENTVLFVEDRGIKEFLDSTNKITVYFWNRDYPADLTLDIDFAEEGFKSVSVCEFEGSSHEKITKEVFEK